MLIYVGDGTFIPDVPARDLDEAEVKKFGIDFLLQSGLYKRAKQPKEIKQLEPAEADGGK